MSNNKTSHKRSDILRRILEGYPLVSSVKRCHSAFTSIMWMNIKIGLLIYVILTKFTPRTKWWAWKSKAQKIWLKNTEKEAKTFNYSETYNYMIIYITIFFLMLIMKNKYSFRGSINRTQEEYFHSFIYALHTFFWPITHITNGVYLFIIYLAISCPNKSDSLSVLFLLSYASGLLEGRIGHTYSNK